ncbi:hypothetical protein OF83DRAFT_1170590 [Amylostereum chailletii]|nr:hypothetical protein OF83DRAFT_1170590 [Amylostereum chailletii]
MYPIQSTVEPPFGGKSRSDFYLVRTQTHVFRNAVQDTSHGSLRRCTVQSVFLLTLLAALVIHHAYHHKYCSPQLGQDRTRVAGAMYSPL